MLSCIRLFVTPWTAAQLPCASLSPGVCPSGQWYHPTISSSVVPFSSWPQSFPASGSFPVSQLFTSGGQSTGASASASVLPINIQGWFPLGLTSFQFSSVTQSCPTLCDPMNCSTPGLPVHHQLPESTQTHVHGVGDAIQPSHPRLSPSPPTLNLSQYQGLLKWVRSLHQVAKVLEFQLQHQSFQWTPRTDLLLNQSSKASIPQCSPFFIVQLSHPYMTTGKKHSLN